MPAYAVKYKLEKKTMTLPIYAPCLDDAEKQAKQILPKKAKIIFTQKDSAAYEQQATEMIF